MSSDRPLLPLALDVARVAPFHCAPGYESRMVLDHTVTGRDNVIQINHGTLAPGAALEGASHRDDEVYYILSGHGACRLGQETIDVHPNQVIFIPAGCFHALDNSRGTQPLCILTFWRDWRQNGAYIKRMEAWGRSYKTVDET